MKITLKYFWRVFLIQFIIMELSLFLCNYLTNIFLQSIIIIGIIIEIIFINKHKYKIINERS